MPQNSLPRQRDKVVYLSSRSARRGWPGTAVLALLFAGGSFAVVWFAQNLPTQVSNPQTLLVAEGGTSNSLPICSGGDRAARRLTCIVDGDTGWENGVKWRLHAIDTPEIGSPECPQEYETGIEARDRLRDLMGTGYAIDWIGEQGSYDRELVNIRLSGGRDAGVMLIEEGLAQPWPNDGNVWCGF